MTKSLYMDPAEMMKPGKITFKDIDVNQYKLTPVEEKKIYTKEDFLRIYHDMRTIREFETMLNEIKVKSVYNGVEYSNPGPAHLSLGQEASAVGEAYLLDVDDYIFGSHRSHGEILAKAMSAIQKIDNKELYESMKNFAGGITLSKIEGKQKNVNDVKELALDYFLYGALAEIFARTTGFSKGLGGSMHAFYTPFGIYPNNAIVGGGAPIALGAAMFKRVNQKKGIVVANIGDASLGCGPVYEAMNMAAMDQIKGLWEEGFNGGMPIIFNVFDNLYGMGGQTEGETMAYQFLARLGAGITPDQMHAERVNGYDPLAVIDAYRRKKDLLVNGDGPVLLDVVTYRVCGHSPSDSDSYRTKEEKDAWIAADPIKAYKEKMINAKIAKEADFDAIDADVIERMTKICALAIDPEVSPRMDLIKHPDTVESIMFSNEHIENRGDRKPEVGKDVLIPYEENPRVQQLAKKERFAFDADGKPISKNKIYQLRDGLFEAIIKKFYEDPTLIAYGEDNRDWGGAFAVYRGLTEAIPYHRFFNSPISEAAIVGSAVGYAMSGGRVIAELMYCDFLGRAGDEVFNQLAKWQSMSAGILKMPVVLRVSVGSKYGAQHSQDWTSLCAHIPGLKVIFPATPYDAKGLMNTALNGSDPVICFESQRIYDIGEQFHEGGVPEGYYEIPIGEPDVKIAGSDVTILSIGATLYRVVEAAKELKEKYNVSAEVIDARSIVPFNYEKVIESVKKTGKIILTSDACERGSALNDMAAKITEYAFDYLDAPPVVVGARNWITPCYELDKDFFPQASWMIDAISDKLLPLAGRVSTSAPSETEFLRREKQGV
ncbi:MAG: thiamine pyrophosphate-dependent enzyme [Bacillota bacterium]|nr:thiamine pyrophosphate-dependent enzyme [Bacillota bacterium]